jgi:hypothetical protein
VTGISSLNIVLQQGGSARDVNHIQKQATEHTQMLAAQQEAIREADLNARVHEAEETDKLYVKEDGSEGKKERRQPAGEKKKRDEEKRSTLTGKFLDTVA